MHAHNPKLKMSDTNVTMSIFPAEQAHANIKSASNRLQGAALLNFKEELCNLFMFIEDQNVANGRKKTGGNQKERRVVDDKSTINAWAFHTGREHDLRKRVNDPKHPDYDENHEYFGRPAIGRRPKGVPKDAAWENDSIMPLMQKKFNEEQEQIIIDMIKEEGSNTYWNKKSPSAKNLFINKIKKKYARNKDIAALNLVEEPTVEEPTVEEPTVEEPTAEDDEIRADPSQAHPVNNKVKSYVENHSRAQPAQRRGRRGKNADEEEQDERPAKAMRTATAKSPAKKIPAKSPAKKTPNTRAKGKVSADSDNVTAESSDSEEDEDPQPSVKPHLTPNDKEFDDDDGGMFD